MKLALMVLVILSLTGLGYLFYTSYKMLRRVQKQELTEKALTQKGKGSPVSSRPNNSNKK